MMDRHLVILARAPRLGTVKRRLAREVGAVSALRFHRLTTARLLWRLAGDPRWTTWLALTPDAAAARPLGCWREPLRARAVGVVPQGPGDLGQRLARPFQELPRGPVVAIGSDIPDVRAAHVAAAFAALGRHDAVVGPAADGGYWLIGLSRRPRLVPPFAGVRWGGPHALADTLANLERLGLSSARLPVLADVDRARDLRPEHFR